MGSEQVKFASINRIQHSRVPFAGADLANHRVGAVGTPIDCTDRLAHQRSRATSGALLGATLVGAFVVNDLPDRIQ